MLERLFVLGLVFAGATSQFTVSDEQWIAKAEFNYKLPTSLAPIFELRTQTSGECFHYCSMKNCSSVGYSSTMKSCKLYKHDALGRPLPPLSNDMEEKHQMHYKRNFCPPGWEIDVENRMCYFMAASPADTKNRILSYETCEANFMSTMVTFESAKQREKLYSILQAKYANVSKWWTGYAMFDGNLWARPIEEIPGYVKRRGNVAGNNILTTCPVISPQECALLCDRKYKDRCVAFVYNRKTSACCLKHRSHPNANAGVIEEFYTYDKVINRPPQLSLGNCGGNDIRSYHDVTRSTCMKFCKAEPQCVAIAYDPPFKRCYLKYKTCADKESWTGEYYDFRDINLDGPCPYGIRYRDTCITWYRTQHVVSTLADACRRMGGKLMAPIESRKSAIAWGAWNFYNGANMWFDWHDIGHTWTWTTRDDKLQYNDAAYQKWTFVSGEPSGNEHCINIGSTPNGAGGVEIKLNDAPCSCCNFNGLCETPVSLSWPQDCKFTTSGREYHGSVSVTKSGAPCKPWNQVAGYSTKWQSFPDWYPDQAYCRNPDPTIIATGPWCFRMDNGTAEACDIPLCPETDWEASQVFHDLNKHYGAITQNAGVADKYDWTTEPVSTTANALCSLKMDEWCKYYFQGSCYTFYTIPMNYNEAKTICKNTGGYLVSINSRDENHYLAGIAVSLGKTWLVHGSGWYIGITGLDPIVWDSGEPFLQGFWDNRDRGSEDCHFLMVKSKGYWQDYTCWHKTWFICEYALGK